MLQNQTQNQLIKVLENFADDHQQLQSFQFGYASEFAASGDTKFPQLFVEPLPHSRSKGVIFNNYRLIFADIVSKGERNRDEILSDMLEIAKDAIAQLNHPDYQFVLQDNIPLQDFFDKFDVEVSGYIATVSLKTGFDNDRCQIPTDGIGIPTSADQGIVIITDAENPKSPIPVTPGGIYTCIPCAPFDTSCSALNALLTQVERNTLQRLSSTKTGQTISYAAGDDGDREDGRGVDFFTLDCNNSFGNTNRFTDENGLQIYGDNYVIDHLTNLGWYLVHRGLISWTTAMANTLIDTTLGFDDWFIPNTHQWTTLMNLGNGALALLDYSPINNFGFGTTIIWTGTTRAVDTPRAYAIVTSTAITFQLHPKANSLFVIICRKHF